MNDRQSSQSNWTVQQFAEVAGQPWYALQEHGPDGIQRQYTGYAAEIAELAATLNVSPRQLPPATEEEFYASLTSQVRSYELGRQLAADPARGIPQDYAPYDLDRFHAGQQMRAMEDNIRRENNGQEVSAKTVELTPEQRQNLVADFQGYALGLGTPTAAEALAWAEKEVDAMIVAPARNVPPSATETAQNSRQRPSEQSHEQPEQISVGIGH